MSTRLLARALRIRLLQRDGDGFVGRSPSLLQLVADVIGTGVSPTAALDLAEGIIDAADAAGRVVAATIALGAASGADAVAPLVRRGRALLGRAIASHTVDEVARHLRTDDPELAELLDSVRIGTVVTPAAPVIPEAPRLD